MFMKMSNSPSAVLMSSWITAACASCAGLVLVRLAAEDVVARELVLRLLQLGALIGSRLQPIELGDQRVDASSGVLPGWTIATA